MSPPFTIDEEAAKKHAVTGPAAEKFTGSPVQVLEQEVQSLKAEIPRLEDAHATAMAQADFAARASRENARRGMTGNLETSRLLEVAEDAKTRLSRARTELSKKETELNALKYPNGKGKPNPKTPQPEYDLPPHPVVGIFTSAYDWISTKVAGDSSASEAAQTQEPTRTTATTAIPSSTTSAPVAAPASAHRA